MCIYICWLDVTVKVRRNGYDTLVQRIRFTYMLQMTKSFVYVTSKGSKYQHNKPPLIGEHVFSRTEFVC